MATLPDLDTSNIGFIAYINLLDNGMSDIDPTEILSDGNVVSYTQYDNGVEGVMENPWESVSGVSNFYKDLNFRCKSDGWFIVWIDRTNDFGSGLAHGSAQGYFQFVSGWAYTRGTGNAPPNSNLQEAGETLWDQFSNSGAITASASDWSYYNYEFTSATTATLFSEQESSPGQTDGGVSYASGTTRYWHSASCSIKNGVETQYFAGSTIVTGSNGQFGHLDVLNADLMPNSGTTYSNSGDSTSGNVQICHVTLWS